MNPSLTRRPLPAFTLIELLVVISIIALLIAILLPALSAARAAARNSVCLSQQRQIGLSFAMYHNDNDDIFPAYRELNGTATGGDDDFWPLLLIQEQYMTGALVYKCPEMNSLPGRPDFEMIAEPPYPGQTWASRIHYGYNFIYIGGSFREPVPPSDIFKGARLGEIKNPSKTITLVDAKILDDPNGDGFYTVYDRPVPSLNEVPDSRHGGGHALNVLWVDSHATTEGIADPRNPWDELTSSLETDNFWDRK